MDLSVFTAAVVAALEAIEDGPDVVYGEPLEPPSALYIVAFHGGVDVAYPLVTLGRFVTVHSFVTRVWAQAQTEELARGILQPFGALGGGKSVRGALSGVAGQGVVSVEGSAALKAGAAGRGGAWWYSDYKVTARGDTLEARVVV